jgi:hypothetical protein
MAKVCSLTDRHSFSLFVVVNGLLWYFEQAGKWMEAFKEVTAKSHTDQAKWWLNGCICFYSVMIDFEISISFNIFISALI